MEQLVLDVMREAIMTMIKVSAPTLLVALVIGLVVSIFQTATSIQEQTLAFIPKILGVFLAIIIFGSWIMTTLVNFITRLFASFNQFL
ncbi:flagellar biosynthesis protein FliQ [Niameybacter massiliensis]|uniref:Flagellar biosynthetic protein FliQ n=1 Tax=Holtiella tumoricola TaxID=3018743 RepID=A0AA42J1J8_9FIRM|nr:MULTISPECIES: flagellar biosynthesis protein FliQ [Lachnospirales]MDA3732602.1 flagellar biosynthesis protein FliQ [Holtiella tumoricola]